uniref:Uncharacterized protein n=1 Tax=Caenorhabditis japonica TaxID=281687 RepID=A0A8R1ITS0_CAEJA
MLLVYVFLLFIALLFMLRVRRRGRKVSERVKNGLRRTGWEVERLTGLAATLHHTYLWCCLFSAVQASVGDSGQCCQSDCGSVRFGSVRVRSLLSAAHG